MNPLVLVIIILIAELTNQEITIVNANNNIKYETNDSLLFAFNHIRHGARTPCKFMNDEYIDLFGFKWKGICELTKKGFLQTFKLGRIFRKRYKNLINFENSNSNEVCGFSSFSNRTLMSSNAFFYGLFNEDETPKEELKTIPIYDYFKQKRKEITPIFHFSDKKNCPKWEEYKKDNQNLPEVQNFLDSFISKYKLVLTQISQKNQKFKELTKMGQIAMFWDNYMSDYYDDKEIPLFQELHYSEQQLSGLYEDCLDWNRVKHFSLNLGGKAEVVSLITISDYARQMISYMDNVILNKNGNPKLVTYFGHDSTITSMKIFLKKAFNTSIERMPFASNQQFLLYQVNNNKDFNALNKNESKNEKENYIVKYYFNDELKLNISYDEFKKRILKVSRYPNEVEFFCHEFTYNDYIFYSLVLGSIFFLFLIFSICRYCYLKEKKKDKKYVELGENPNNTNNIKDTNISIIKITS